MKRTYTLQRIYRYQSTSTEFQIDLDDSFEFAEAEGSFWKEGYKHYLCVIPEASKFKDILESLEESQAVDLYTLPHDTIIISMPCVEFQPPKVIPIEALNDKLKEVREETVWVELQLSTLDILSVYKLSWVGGEDDVTLCCIGYRRLYESGVILRKSITFAEGQRLGDIESDVTYFSDHKITKTLTGTEAKTLWNSLLGDAIKETGYNPEFYDPEYDYDKYKKGLQQILDIIKEGH